ncbi:MAG TPA: TIGR01777 family oxidoreductase, partial [Actinomycetes bacterium]|nr:TIGR01777 family oxidoreductase [Actinomycetes bacterium]
MLVAVTGASGLIGTALVERLHAEGHQVLRLTRSRPAAPDQVHWDPASGELDPDALAKADAVVHLAATNIGEHLRWTARIKRELLESRVEGTSLVARTMAELATRSGGNEGPRLLVCASGVHYYGDRGDAVLTEADGGGPGFLAGVVRQWEAAADPARAAGLRVVHLRTGLVQDVGGAGLPKQVLMFRFGLGGRLGSGRQWLSWIALDDIAGAYLHALTHDELEGPVNAVAPDPVTNAEFTRVLARVLGRPAFLHVPAIAPKLVLG